MRGGKRSACSECCLRCWVPLTLPRASRKVPSGLGDFADPAFGTFLPPPPSLVTKADLEPSGLKTLEHVAVTVSITHPRRGNLEIHLLCPSGMDSLVGTARSMDS